jgi:O-antigen/teichoic acid export membrane protein
MSLLRRFRSDLLALLVLLLLALLWFAPVLFPALSGRTLLPWDNLYTFEPWRSLQPNLIPHNGLLSDLVLENAVWKLHIRSAIEAGQLPLWNPQILSGIPFLAAGQASTFYPLNILFYVLPLEPAYAWFTALQVALAGMSMYVFGRVLRLRVWAALLGGVLYMFSGFLIVSVVFTMFIAAVPWLPLLLAVIEAIVRKQEEKGAAAFTPTPYVAAGAVITGLIVLAGHPELIYYSLITAGAYALVRLVAAWRLMTGADAKGRTWCVVRLGLWLMAMVALGVALGSVQLIPLVELLPLNFRQGSASLQQVQEWAWPVRQLLTFPLPDVFGNPSHHAWFDIWQLRWQQVTVNALGEPIDTIFWGIKNYVEGGNYLSVAAWLLAGIALAAAVVSAMARWRSDEPRLSTALGVRPVTIWFFAGLAVVSLLFAFGTPLYALLYYALPGWSQLHSPFRWVFPYTLSMAALAAVGLHVLITAAESSTSSSVRRVARVFAAGAMAAGVVALALVVVSRFAPDAFVTFGQRIMDGSDLARGAFADGRMFWVYQTWNLLRFGLFAAATGLLVWLLASRRRSARAIAWIAAGLILVVALDLYATHGRFNPAADIALSPLRPSGTPAVVTFLEERENGNDGTWRFTTFNLPGEKTLNANVGMYFGWHDLRGYDSIIPLTYVNLMNQIAPQGDELLYNRIAPVYAASGGDPYAVLENPLLDLLNVKYVLTEHAIPNASWQEVYRDASIAVYENLELQPRAFVASEATVAVADQQPLTGSDLRRTVFIEETPAEEGALVPASPQLADARISRSTATDVFIDVNLSDRGWLVLADGWFPGWKAYIRPFASDESEEREVPIYRADGALRAVYLPDDGQWTVRFVYSPMSFKVGLYVSFLAVMTMFLLGFLWLWGKYYHPEVAEGEARTVAKNSVVPMGLSMANKLIDFAFAMLYVRILGPEGTGKWYFVVALYGFFEIISRYGLGTLLTRDVAEDKNRSSHYLTNVLVLRTLLWLAVLPVMAIVTWFYANLGSFNVTVLGYHLFGGTDVNVQPIGPQEVQAIAILALAMIFANYADAFSSMFYAFEKMEYPAAVANAAALMKVSLGALVLLLGWSFVGLALVSLAVNVVQVVWLYVLMRTTLFEPELKSDRSLQKWMFLNSGPLMINHLLATIFWRIDVWILRPLAGAVSVGLYSVGLKYLDGLNIIPSMFTLALFPLMSRLARRDGDSLLRSYVLSLRLLVMISLPIAAAVTFLARPMVYIVGGPQYLDVPGEFYAFGRTIPYMGGGDLALQIIIWSIPFGFVNSVTQYALIAVKQQHYLTRAFIIGVIFNVGANLVLIPHFGYVAAAGTTVASEICLLIPFAWSVRRHVGTVPWFSISARPILATLAMLGLTFGLVSVGINVWLSVTVGAGAYVGLLWLTGALHEGDMDALRRALPFRSGRRKPALES